MEQINCIGKFVALFLLLSWKCSVSCVTHPFTIDVHEDDLIDKPLDGHKRDTLRDRENTDLLSSNTIMPETPSNISKMEVNETIWVS